MLRTYARNKRWLCGVGIVGGAPTGAGGAAPMNKRREDFTGTELALLPYLAEDLTNAEIAEALTLNAETVKSHVAHIMAKTGIHDRRVLGRAIRSGDIPRRKEDC